jgi:hypothetical protein
MGDNSITELGQAQFIDGGFLIGSAVVLVHIHKNITNHGHDETMVVPNFDDGGQQLIRIALENRA